MEITITVDARDVAWGAEADEEIAEVVAGILAERLAAFAQLKWPEAEVETKSLHEEGRVIVQGADDAERALEVKGIVRAEIQRTWTDALAAALAESEA